MTLPPDAVAITLIVLFAAAFTKSVLGFGEALIAVPLLTLALGVQTAAPVSVLMASAVTLVMLIKNWRAINFQAIWRLIAAAVVGIPLGVWGLTRLPEVWLTTLLGGLLIAIGLYYLRRPTLPPQLGERWTYVFGFFAGLLGGAYNIAGPPLIVYGTMRRWSPDQFRSTLQGFFIVVDGLILISHAGAGLWTPDVLQLFGLSLPAIALGFWLGNRLNRAISPALFARLVYIALVILGVMLLL